jgi:DNA-binding XRE family transcriptional regulator
MKKEVLFYRGISGSNPIEDFLDSLAAKQAKKVTWVLKLIEGEKMSDLKKYITKRKKKDPDFAKDYNVGYEDFKLGVMLKAARKKAGMTQEQVAEYIHTKKEAISRLENHSEDIRLSTLEKYASAIGRKVTISLK